MVGWTGSRCVLCVLFGFVVKEILVDRAVNVTVAIIVSVSEKVICLCFFCNYDFRLFVILSVI